MEQLNIKPTREEIQRTVEAARILRGWQDMSAFIRPVHTEQQKPLRSAQNNKAQAAAVPESANLDREVLLNE